MAVKKAQSEKVRQTLSKALKLKFPDLFKRQGGRSIGTATLGIFEDALKSQKISDALRESILQSVRGGKREAAHSYTPEEVGEFVLDFPGLPCNK